MDVPTFTILKLLGAGAAAAIVGWAFIKGWIVPGWMYLAEKERGDRNEKQLEQTWPLLQRLIAYLDRAEEVKRKVEEVVKETKSDNSGGGR